MANSLGIDFSPQPAYGSDPFTPVVEGVQMGLGLQRDIQNQKLQQQQFQLQEQMKKDQQKQEKLATLSSIPTQSWFKSLSQKDKDEFAKSYSSAIRDYAGVDINITGWKDNYKEYAKRSADILGSPLDIEKKRIAYANLLLEAQDNLSKDEVGFLKEAANMGLSKTGRAFARQVPGRVTDKGYPLFFDPETEQYQYRDPSSGETVPYLGQQYPAMANPSASAENELRDVYQQRGLTDEALSVLTPDKVGVIDKRFKSVGAYVDKSTDPEAIYFRSLIELANTVIRKNFYGATLTNNEQAAFKDIAANRSLSPSAFRAQVRAMQFAFNKLENAIRKSSGEANRPFRTPNVSSDNSDLSTMSDEELARIAAGGK